MLVLAMQDEWYQTGVCLYNYYCRVKSIKMHALLALDSDVATLALETINCIWPKWPSLANIEFDCSLILSSRMQLSIKKG